ncbi:MAG: efflux RND transporter permease subunit [Micropepsaceae bacterium]
MRGLSTFFVRHWQFTLVLFAMLAALGLNALRTIPRAEDPHFPIPVMIVKAVLPGADPMDMERLVADPIEGVIDSLDDVKEIRSTSQNGIAIISVEFDWNSDADKKYDDVLREVNALKPTLPEGLARLEVDRIRTTDANIVQVALLSDSAPWKELEDRAHDLKDVLDRLPGVDKARFWGIPESEVRVAINLGKLAALGLPLTRVAEAVEAEGKDVPPGAIHAGGRRFNIKATGSFRSIAEVGDVVVFAAGGRTVRVRDVAEVGWASDEPEHLTRYNGKRAVFVTATQKSGENVFAVRDRVWAELDRFEKELPASIRMERPFDQSKSVDQRLSHLFLDFAFALSLVLVTLLPLGFRASLIVMMSIPLSLAIGVSALQFTGFSLNQLSIAGFVLALGLLVDDSIVVTENIARHLREGKSRRQAAMEATGQILVAVLGCTVTLVLAFLPLLFLPEGAGKFTLSLPVSILFTVAASFFVALTIIPFLASRLLPASERPEGNRALQAVHAAIRTIYNPILHRALLHPKQTLGLAALLVAASLPLVPIIGFSLFPPASAPIFLVDVEMPDGTALSRTDEVLRQVEAVLGDEPEVRWYLSNLGHGNPQIFYNMRQRETATNFAEVFVSLGEWDAQHGPRLLDALRKRFDEIPGAQIVVREFSNGPPMEAPIVVRILGKDIVALRQLAVDASRIVEETPGTRDVVNSVRLNRTDLELGVDEAKAGALGVPAGAIDRTMRIALEGQALAQYRTGDGREYDVSIRLPFAARHDLETLNRVYLPTQEGAGVPLSLVTHPRLAGGPNRIDRFGRQRAVTITSQVATHFVTSSVNEDVFAKLGTLKLPSGYRIAAGGEAEAQVRSFGGLWSAMLLALFGIMAALILEFRSFRVSAVVAGVIPLGIVGGIVALWLTGYTMSFTAVIGFIALVGIEIKNSILLVDFTVQLQRQGTPLREAIERAGEIRFLPVLLTSATAIGGLLPLAVEGSGLYSPLALVIIGGLVTSTLLSRIVTPVMYLLLAPRGRRTNVPSAAAQTA